MKPVLLIVDDDEEIRAQMRWALASDYELKLAEDRPSAITAFKLLKPTLTLLDLGLPPSPGSTEEGFAALREIQAQDPNAKVIVITGQAEKANAMQAVTSGAYDFVSKPIDLDELRVVLKRAAYLASLEAEYAQLQRQSPVAGFEGMLGGSIAMQQVFSTIKKVSDTDAPILLLGESGTGKEMAALAIHGKSSRKGGPFIAINCGAIPGALLESELFGHERGAFTGAHMQRRGRLEMADQGTILLDEIGDLPAELQVKLLRFLQERSFERIGGRESIQVDTRVIAATNSDLTKATREGRFREDLYYRLAVIVLKLPALREREGDVELLARQFLSRFASEQKKSDMAFDPDALRAISQHAWPGNVRELENRVKRAVIMAETRWITAADLELAGSITRTTSYNLKLARESVERELITTVLRKHSGKMTQAAAELGISRPTLYELVEKLGLNVS